MEEREAKRARRRRDKQRMKARARRVYGRNESTFFYSRPPHQRPDPARHEKLADHIAHCSGPCCGNPRRHAWFKGERITLQERRFLCDDGE